MISILSIVTWLLIGKVNVFKTRFLYLIKAAKTNNIDTIATKSVIGHILGDIVK